MASRRRRKAHQYLGWEDWEKQTSPRKFLIAKPSEDALIVIPGLLFPSHFHPQSFYELPRKAYWRQLKNQPQRNWNR
jgi:hypothetical protein